MQPTSRKSSALTDMAFWLFASSAFVALAVAATYVVGNTMRWGLTTRTFAGFAAATLSLTWGSWSSLIWTRNRLLRMAMESIALIPGMLILALGLLGMYIGWGGWYLWLALMFPAAGTIAISVLLVHDVSALDFSPGWGKYVIGFTIFPLGTLAGSSAIAYLWYHFITRPLGSDWRSLLSLATVMVTVLAMVLITTVIPAMLSRWCRQLSVGIGKRRS